MGHLDAGATPNGPRQHQDVSEARRGILPGFCLPFCTCTISTGRHPQGTAVAVGREGGVVAIGGSRPKSQPGQRAQESERAQPVHVAGVSHEGPCAFSERFELPLSCEWDP